MDGQPVKKILVSARVISTPKVEVKSLHIRAKISINRKGVTALAVSLLSFFVRLYCKPVSYSGCRSPPSNLDFQKIQIGLRGKRPSGSRLPDLFGDRGDAGL